MAVFRRYFIAFLTILSITLNAQDEKEKVVVITGARFSYKLVQRWIDEYNKVNPDVQIIIESRGSSDPAGYDILAEVYEQAEEVKKEREYLYVGRYAILPVATSSSRFAKVYGDKGVNKDIIKKVFFNDMFEDQEKQVEIKVPFTVYTRLQKAGAPNVFAKHFGFEQKDIAGKAIAGSDEHLLKALLRDTAGVSYLPLSLIYDLQTRQPVAGLSVLPVDISGNGKLGDDERFFNNLDNVIGKLENSAAKDLKNIPIEYLHLSVAKSKVTDAALDFLKWVNENGQQFLHEHGYLVPDTSKAGSEKFNELASRRTPVKN